MTFSTGFGPGVLILACCSATTAGAQDFCTRLSDLNAQVTALEPTTFDLSPIGEIAECQPSRGLGGTVATHCAWPFAYRDAAATSAFERILDAVDTCALALPPDPSSVSHPDSYDLRQFQLGPATVSVSLKDKGALQQTYVFLRVERSP